MDSVFAENLKKHRVQQGISQEEMARKIGVHATHLSRYERGLSAPSIEVVQKIAETLDVSIDELVFGNQGQKIEQAMNDRELVNLFKKVQLLNDKQKDTVKDLLSAFILKNNIQQQLVH